MPCFTREKSITTRRKKVQGRDALAPKGVRPRAMRYHGLLSESIAAQHLIVDENWSPSSLTEQFVKLTELFRSRAIYKRHEIDANRRRLKRESKRLKLQCYDGRIKLNKIKVGNNSHKIRNFLIDHRDMQRLYQKMPIHLVVDNINQRTFVLRKERDRLQFRLEQRKLEYKSLLVERAQVENRIRYENEFVLEEELISRVLLKKIENSSVRLKAIITINTTYRKMVQVLKHDEIFYEPILRSLDDDMEDQANFIKHILYLGMPAIANFKRLNAEYRQNEKKSQENFQAKVQMLNSLLKPTQVFNPAQIKTKPDVIPSTDITRYLRETQSMAKLRMEMQTVEKTIKELKFVTLSSQAKEIYPRFTNQGENNAKMGRRIELATQEREMLEIKTSCTKVLESVLINNLSDEEISRLERINHLKEILKQDQEFQQETLEYLKYRADAYVMLRVSLWNLLDILRSVDHAPKFLRPQYPNSYLRLPLLKFDAYYMRTVAPDLYEENIDNLMNSLKRKVYKLVKSFKPQMSTRMKEYRDRYHTEFVSTVKTVHVEEEDQQAATVADEGLLHERALTSIPNRKQIKAQSARLVEEILKRDNE